MYVCDNNLVNAQLRSAMIHVVEVSQRFFIILTCCAMAAALVLLLLKPLPPSATGDYVRAWLVLFTRMVVLR